MPLTKETKIGIQKRTEIKIFVYVQVRKPGEIMDCAKLTIKQNKVKIN